MTPILPHCLKTYVWKESRTPLPRPYSPNTRGGAGRTNLKTNAYCERGAYAADRQVDYGHALISPINRSKDAIIVPLSEYDLSLSAPSPWAPPLTTTSTPRATGPMIVQSLLTIHNYGYRTSAILDQRENIDSMSTINRPCVRSRQAGYGHVLIAPYTGR